jgi:serine/threonine-protein kinase
MAPRRFGRHEVQREIGEGAMGRVYRCLDPMMKRVVAVKTVKKEFLTRETRDEYLRRFRREAQAAGRLSHPSIVSVFDVGEDYFVMEYLEGSTLQVILRERGQLAADEAIRILEPLAEALDYAHRSGVIHRDIKPGNVFVMVDGRPKLMDFGVAHLESSAMTAQGHFFGSPSYMAPEQVSGGEVAAAADLFSLAVVAYEMITGHRPFEGASITAIMYRVVNEDAPPPRQWDFELPAVYDDIFRRALAKNPAERFLDASSFVRALERREFVASTMDPVAELEETLSPSAAARLAAATGTATPVPPALVGSVETQDLQSALAREASKTRPLHGRRTTLAAAGVAAGLLALYLGRGSEPAPPAAPPPASAPGVLRIETEPAGASVWFDGAEVVERAPVTLRRVRPGTHMVRVAAEGYAPANLTLVTRPGEPLPPLRFVMDPLRATLRVRSEPAGALVRVDGQSVGTTPLDALSLTPGRHGIRLERRGYAAASQEVDGRAGERLDVSVRLERQRPGPLSTPPPPVAEGDLVTLDATVIKPRKISKSDSPSYPREAERLGLQGSVIVDILVDENGQVKDPHVIESAGILLDRAVLSAISHWRYEPARKNGVKVKVRMQVKTTFKQP